MSFFGRIVYLMMFVLLLYINFVVRYNMYSPVKLSDLITTKREEGEMNYGRHFSNFRLIKIQSYNLVLFKFVTYDRRVS